MKLINVVLNMLSMTGLASCIGLNTCPIQMSTSKKTFSEPEVLPEVLNAYLFY